MVPTRVVKVSKDFGALAHNTSELGLVDVLGVGRAEGKEWKSGCGAVKHFLTEVSMFLVSWI